MQQLTIFDAANEPIAEVIEIIPRPGIIKNQVSILYKGFHVANARDCGDGFYEVRPKAVYFTQRDQKIRIMSKEEIKTLCKQSFVDYEI